MYSKDLQEGHELIIQTKIVHEVIEDSDTGDFLVLFTDNTWEKVDHNFDWEIL